MAAGAYSGVAALYDPRSLEMLMTLTGHTGGITQVLTPFNLQAVACLLRPVRIKKAGQVSWCLDLPTLQAGTRCWTSRMLIKWIDRSANWTDLYLASMHLAVLDAAGHPLTCRHLCCTTLTKGHPA